MLDDGETVRAMKDAQAAGKIKYLGGSCEGNIAAMASNPVEDPAYSELTAQPPALSANAKQRRCENDCRVEPQNE